MKTKKAKLAAMRAGSSAYAWLIYLLLYLPIAVVVVFAFNANTNNIRFTGFSLQWFGKLMQDAALLKAFGNTLVVAVCSTLVSTVIGTLAAVGMWRYKFKGKGIIDALLYIPVVIPEIVLGISLLSLFSLTQVPMGLFSLILAHVTFQIPFVVFTVKARLFGFDRSIEEASMDLGANKTETFINVTLPIIFPGILSGALLAFTLSIDDVIISSFTAGPATTTFPIKVMQLIRAGVTPDVNALTTLVLAATALLVFLTQMGGLKNKNNKS
ncbi:spermidine/putrescine transport system permease protein [Sporobacter termitidis DSM 10068]|uniref:Spermidine/putrescine transport system permease protein n=1 Tax=Sporobacter termitidis DSM 10068 TaxID=1123282 RepID=A0A1M5XF27_9FIRM|nr:spermidine/putrescine transport system permease protein [Sporobacter termitidis DSM 10068]